MKKILISMLLCCGLTACQKTTYEHHDDSHHTSQTKAYEHHNDIHHSALETQEKYLIDRFFEAFEKQDYEAMKAYCTQECIDNLFHEDNVWGIKSAKIKNIDTTKCLSHHEYSSFVEIEIDPTKESALYPETSTYVYIVFLRNHNQNLKIHSIETG